MMRLQKVDLSDLSDVPCPPTSPLKSLKSLTPYGAALFLPEILGIQPIQNRQRFFHIPRRRHGAEVVFGIP